MERGNRILWLVVVAWWTLDGLVDSVQLMSMEGPGGVVLGARRAFVLGMASSLLWIPFSLALLWCAQRYPVERGNVARGVVANTAMVLGIVLLRAVAVVVLNPWVGWYTQQPAFGQVLLTSLLNNFLLLWMMVGVAHAWHFARRERERRRQTEQLQARLTTMRLDALNAQLNPHFLFNALNSIAEVVHHDAAAADRMLVALGELLRASLDHEQSQLVTLNAELRLLRHYLEIESLRLGERLRIDWRIEPGLGDAGIPPLLLQPLAENAVMHAIATRLQPGLLRIVAVRADDHLRLVVEDDGNGNTARPGHGIGLDNVRARMALLFGHDQSVVVTGGNGAGTQVTLEMPFTRIATTPVLGRAA